MEYIDKLGQVNDYSHYSKTHCFILTKFYSLDIRKEFQVGGRYTISIHLGHGKAEVERDIKIIPWPLS